MTAASPQRRRLPPRSVLAAVLAGLGGVSGALLAATLIVVWFRTSTDVYAAGELPAEAVAVPAGTRTIVVVGDILLWDRAEDYLRQFGANDPFRATAALLQTADLTVGHLEGPVVESTGACASPSTHRVPPWTIGGLSWAGFDLVDLASDRLDDCGPEGILETLGYVREAGIQPFGAGRSLDEARTPVRVDLGGITVAWCSLLAVESEPTADGEPTERAGVAELERLAKLEQATAERPGTVVGTPEAVADAVRAARREADLVVASLHWGLPHRRQPTALQRAIAHAAIEAGADVVVGHHARHWQTVELYRGRPILFGLGRFAYGTSDAQPGEALLARLLLTASTLDAVELFPLRTEPCAAQVLDQPKLMRGRAAQRMLRRLAQQSSAPLLLERTRAVLAVPPQPPTP